MSENLSATIEVGLDGSKVREGVAPIARTLENLGKTAKKAGDDASSGIGRIGDGGASSAAKVESATRNMIGSIQRTTAAMEAGTKSGVEYFEALARQRGVDPSALRPYLAQLDAVREKQESAATSSAAMSTALKSASFAAVAAASGFVTIIKGTIDAADGLNDLSKTTGIAVEQLAGLRLAAQQSGGDLDGIAKSINKLSMNIGKDGEKFKQLGIDAKDPLEAFKQLSDIFKSIEDPQTRAALGAAALGKSWESAAPLLSEGSVAIGEMVAKGTELSGVTSQLTKDSDAFNDSIAEVSAGIAGQFAGATTALLPLMGELAKSLSDASAAANKAPDQFSPLAEIFRALIIVGGNVAFVFKGVGREIGGIAAQVAAFASADFKGAIAIGEMIKQDAEEARKSFDEWEQRILKVGTVAKETSKEIAKVLTPDEEAAKKKQEERNAEFIKASNEKVVSLKKEENAYQSLSKFIREKLSISELELGNEKPLTEAQKLRVKVMELVESAHGKMAKARAMELLKQTDLIRANEAMKNSYEGLRKELEKYKPEVTAKDITDFIQRQDGAYLSIIESQEQYGQSLQDNADLMQLELGYMGQSAAVRNTAIEQLRIQIALNKELRKIEENYLLSESRKQELSDSARANASIAKSQTELRVQQQEWTKFYDDIYNGLTDSLYRGFEAGKGFFQSFWDGIKNLFKTTVLKLAVQGVMTGVFGSTLGNVANAATVGGGGQSNPIGNLTSMYTAGKTMWEGFSAAGTIGGGVTTLGNALGSSTLSAFGSGMSMTSTQAAGAAAAYNGAGMASTGSAISAGSSAAAALPIVGWVLAGMAANNRFYDQGWGTSAGKTSNATAIASGLSASALEGTIQKWFGLSDKAASMWSGSAFTNRLFGHQAAQIQQSELTGSFGGEDSFAASIRNVFKEKGGVFRGDKWSETKTAVGGDQAKELSALFDSIKIAATGYSDALGLSSDSLKSFSKDFKVNLSITGDAAKDAEANKKIWSDLIVGVADDLTKSLMPSIADFAKENEKASETFARIATNISAVNGIFKDLNLTLFKTTDAGIKASVSFAELFGGLDQLQVASQSYYENFFSEEERSLKAKAALSTELSKVGLGDLNSRDAYRQAVELADKAGNTESLATLLKLNGAFAQLYPAMDKTAQAAEVLKDAADAAQLSMRKLGTNRREELQGRRASDEAAQAIRKESDDAFKALTESVTSGLQAMLRAGDVQGALSAKMSITTLNPAQYTDASGFNAGAFNRSSAFARAEAAKNMMTSVSADALNTQNVSSVMEQLLARVFDEGILATNKTNLISALKLPASDLLRGVLSGMLDVGVQSYVRENGVGRGAGIASVIGAQMDYAFASFEGAGKDVVEYTKFVTGLNWSLDKGKLSQQDYASALDAANKIMGASIDLIGDEVAQRERIAASQKSLNEAGLSSVSFYFNEIGKSVEAMNAAAVQANAPLAQVSSAIGRLTSLSDVFSQSASAALSGGANLGNGSLINAQIVADAAAKAASAITTADASQAAKLLADKESFAGVGGAQLRDVSMILDGVKSFDSVGFEASFMRMNDALNKGAITQDQYQDIFATSLNLYQGIAVQQDRELKERTDFVDNLGSISGAMKDFYNQLLIDPSKSTLSQSARMEEVMRQYDEAKSGLISGDASRINDFKSLAGQIADASNYSSRADANYGYSRVLADAQLIGIYTQRDTNAPQVQAIQNLEKSINERLDKQFAIMRSQLDELQKTRLDAARKNLPTGVSA